MALFKKKEVHYPQFWENYATTFVVELPKKIEDLRFVVLDTETTGLDPETDRILCMGALEIKNGSISVINSIELYIDQYYYHAKNIEIHGILKEERCKRITELKALQQLLPYLGNSILEAIMLVLILQ